MGRRATATTKGGRFMNPADQERKQNRKKELKKNKKQRTEVRKAVLKSKDPHEILDQMRKLDAMEFDPDNPPPLAQRVMDEKRQKLRETYGRVLGMYKREEQMDKFQELKKEIYDYDRMRAHLMENYQAIKFAKEANPAEIPLPDGNYAINAAMTPNLPRIHIPTGIPPAQLRPELSGAAAIQSILKKGAKKRSDGPPGPPCGLPPNLTDSEGESGDDDEAEDEMYNRRGRVRFDAPQEEKDSRTKFKELARRIAAGEKIALPDDDQPPPDDDSIMDNIPMPSSFVSQPRLMGGPGMNPLIPAGARLLRPPPPPPGVPPPRMGHFPVRLPPGVLPPGVRLPQPHNTGAVLSAPPSISKSLGAIIEAKPQLRNMQQEVTKLVPTAVRVKREAPLPVRKKLNAQTRTGQSGGESSGQSVNKDDAYAQFMNEMTGLL